MGYNLMFLLIFIFWVMFFKVFKVCKLWSLNLILKLSKNRILIFVLLLYCVCKMVKIVEIKGLGNDRVKSM